MVKFIKTRVEGEILNRKSQLAFGLSRLTVSFALLALVGAVPPTVASAATITVTNPTDLPLPFTCNLRQAIVAHNQKTKPFPSDCTKGDGNDTIVISRFPGERTVDSGSPLPAIANGTLTIKPIESTSVCVSLRQSAYMTVNKGATLNLEGIGIVVNGAEPLSPIDNNGGTLNIFPHAGTLRCLFSNQNGRGFETIVGGVLNDRNGGNATINANFQNSSARSSGGAILVADGSTVAITGGTFSGNNAAVGGAISLVPGATLKIVSSNFSISNNHASTDGGAIDGTAANISIQRDPGQTLGSVSISSNSAPLGGAILAIEGSLNIDGVQFLGNSASGSAGAIGLSGVGPQKPASITHTYFRDNSASVGASIAVGNSTTLNLSGDTFVRNKGGINVNNFTNTVGVINSTFVGGTGGPDGISVESGSSIDVTFSTIRMSNLAGPSSGFNLSDSILDEVNCTNVSNAGNNQGLLSPSCPITFALVGLANSLQDNGGPTPTIALPAASSAIDVIPIGECLDLAGNTLTVDQRDAHRPFPVGGNCDVGAYEFGAAATPGLLPPGTTF